MLHKTFNRKPVSNDDLLVIRIFWVPFRREYSNSFIVSYVNINNILAQAHLYDEK